MHICKTLHPKLKDRLSQKTEIGKECQTQQIRNSGKSGSASQFRLQAASVRAGVMAAWQKHEARTFSIC
ncbi:MAG: hypothetical protein B6245_09255 [Desulfobacteraceae bacterium 4572_88]|nr:MAG: hypothetical protein B6245_09255 [Desulfobacteraceae bacterium 4572_88]